MLSSFYPSRLEKVSQQLFGNMPISDPSSCIAKCASFFLVELSVQVAVA